jgi:hypothetical protein
VRDDERTFLRVGPPSDGEIARVAERVHRLVTRLMKLWGLGPKDDPDEADTLVSHCAFAGSR